MRVQNCQIMAVCLENILVFEYYVGVCKQVLGIEHHFLNTFTLSRFSVKLRKHTL
jgi:hypothetical protein